MTVALRPPISTEHNPDTGSLQSNRTFCGRSGCFFLKRESFPVSTVWTESKRAPAVPFALPAMGSILTCISSTTGFATMRRIDRDRIEESYVVRTLVKCGEVRWHVLICERRWHRMRPIVMGGTISREPRLSQPQSNSIASKKIAQPEQVTGKHACYNSLPKSLPFRARRSDSPTSAARLYGASHEDGLASDTAKSGTGSYRVERGERVRIA